MRTVPSPPGGPPLICAHACTMDGGSPSTLAGLGDLVADRVEMVEIDVRRTRDGVLVAHHDERLPDRRPLRCITATDVAAAYPSDARPARLEELVVAAGHKTRVQLDLKEDGIEQDTLRLALDAVPVQNIVVTTLDARQVARVKALAPDVRVGLSLNRSPGAFSAVSLGRAGAAPTYSPSTTYTFAIRACPTGQRPRGFHCSCGRSTTTPTSPA